MSEVVLVCMYVCMSIIGFTHSFTYLLACDAHDAIAYHVMEVKNSEDRRRQNSPGLYKTVNCSTKE